MGSKSRISKEIIPIIQKYVDGSDGYFEPFMGGMNVVDKVNCAVRLCSDSHKQLVALFKQLQEDPSVFPEYITNGFYNEVSKNKDKYEDWMLGIVGFCSSYGAKYFAGYARDFKGDETCNISRRAIKNLLKQRENILDVEISCQTFNNILPDYYKNFTFYCDPPYKGTTGYKTGEFPYEDFYKWCRLLKHNGNTVLVSEYNMPEDFDCIWQKDVKILIDNNKKDKINTEKLFICR